MLVSPPAHEDTLGELTPREQEVLALMAEDERTQRSRSASG